MNRRIIEIIRDTIEQLSSKNVSGAVVKVRQNGAFIFEKHGPIISVKPKGLVYSSEIDLVNSLI